MFYLRIYAPQWVKQKLNALPFVAIQDFESDDDEEDNFIENTKKFTPIDLYRPKDMTSRFCQLPPAKAETVFVLNHVATKQLTCLPKVLSLTKGHNRFQLLINFNKSGVCLYLQDAAHSRSLHFTWQALERVLLTSAKYHMTDRVKYLEDASPLTSLKGEDKETSEGSPLMALTSPGTQNDHDEESPVDSDNDDASEGILAVAYGDTVDMNHYYFGPDFAG